MYAGLTIGLKFTPTLSCRRKHSILEENEVVYKKRLVLGIGFVKQNSHQINKSARFL